jgi:hypothetical protein
MWFRAEQGKISNGFVREEVPCRNARDECGEVTLIDVEPGTAFPKRILCKRCEKYGTPSERLGTFNFVLKGHSSAGVSRTGTSFNPSGIVSVTCWPSGKGYA